jgi:hypothetical protein
MTFKTAVWRLYRWLQTLPPTEDTIYNSCGGQHIAQGAPEMVHPGVYVLQRSSSNRDRRIHMPFQAVPQVIRVEPIYLYDSQYVENVLHYRYEVPWVGSELSDFAAAWLAKWQTNIRPQQPTNVSLVSIKVTDLSFEFAPGIEFTTGLPVAGSATGTGLPNNVSIAVRLLTALRGRSYRGRTYHIGVRATDVALNQITTLFQTALVTGYTSMRSVSTTQAYAQVVVSRVAGGALRPTGVATPVTAIQVDRVIDSQRRRLPGRGR